MNLKEQNECKRLLKRYAAAQEQVVRDQLRNAVFEKLTPFLQRWIWACVLKWRMYDLSQQDVLSMSWEAFLRGLKNYSPMYPVPKHFHIHTVYYLKGELLSKDKPKEKGTVSSEDLPLPISWEDPSQVSDLLLDLKRLREFLPENYKLIFDDAIRSLSPNIPDRCKDSMKTCGINYHRYFEAKRVIKMFICFMLGRPHEEDGN